MTKYILHGGYTRRHNELNRSFYEEFAKDVPEGGTVLLCYFASREEDHGKEIFGEQAHAIEVESPRRAFNFVMASKGSFLDEFKAADAVYFHGGSTRKLLETLRAYPDLKPFAEGKTVAGSSAGAYMLARYGASHSESAMREGLGFVPLRVICHYKSPDLPPDPSAVELLTNSHQDLELVLLHDCEWKAFEY
jgi:peptidase E